MANDIVELVQNMAPEDQELTLIRLLELAQSNPADIGFPPMLPIELAMKVDTVQNIAKAYGLDKAQFTAIISHPVFIKAYQEAIEMLKVEGMSFKLKCRMQSESYLGVAYKMVQSAGTSDSVRADIIKNTVRWAGLDTKAADTGAAGSNFNIQINLG